jgi:hypothetical protein
MGSSSAGSSGSSDAPTKRKHTATPKKNTLQKVGDFVKGGGVTGMFVRAVKGKITDNKLVGTSDWQGGGKSRVATNYQPENDNRPAATNVGGKIVKVPSPTTSEISQSNATDVTYDERKTKSKGRSMTILTSSKGVRKDDELVLGKKSLLGRA